MKSILIPSAIVSGLLIVGAIASLAIAQPPRDDVETPLTAYAGKILVISFRSDPESTATLEKVQLRQVAAQRFLVGKAVDDGTPRSWNKGATTWVALEDVAQIIEFPNVEAMKKAIDSYSDADEVF